MLYWFFLDIVDLGRLAWFGLCWGFCCVLSIYFLKIIIKGYNHCNVVYHIFLQKVWSTTFTNIGSLYMYTQRQTSNGRRKEIAMWTYLILLNYTFQWLKWYIFVLCVSHWDRELLTLMRIISMGWSRWHLEWGRNGEVERGGLHKPYYIWLSRWEEKEGPVGKKSGFKLEETWPVQMLLRRNQ